MRPVQKILVDFANIDLYAKSLESLRNRQAAKLLKNAKADMLSIYDKQAPNYSALVTIFEDSTCTVAIVSHDYWL